MTDIQTPDFEGRVQVGAFQFQTEHALAAMALGALALLWVLRFAFPRP